ncbi:dipeptide ABC transporter ATP-binding protein [Thorsellia kenyensis]|uniref:Dipeptide ABC transporter ATP-binding protein n=1 Tax=Thorsellia kenyensis TaxID=1549888 RepID=A0ABV6CAG1_9GAMM
MKNEIEQQTKNKTDDENASESLKNNSGLHKTVILKADNLKKHYEVKAGLFKKPKLVKALDGVSFELRIGSTLAVVGESGCGKSTLGKLLTMIETPTEGNLFYQGAPLAFTQSGEQLRKIQMIFQNPYSSLNPRKKIGDILSEPLIVNTQLTSKEIKEEVLGVMAKVGLKAEFYDRYPHMFSGGQRQRIAIARGLMLKPSVVVADEPVSALDVSVRAQVLNLMMELQTNLNLAYVFISHDLTVVKHIADEIMVMYLGRCVEKASTEVIFSNPKHPYTQALLSATPSLREKNKQERIRLQGELPSPLNPPKGCAFSARCMHAIDKCFVEAPPLLELKERSIACHLIQS